MSLYIYISASYIFVNFRNLHNFAIHQQYMMNKAVLKSMCYHKMIIWLFNIGLSNPI